MRVLIQRAGFIVLLILLVPCESSLAQSDEMEKFLSRQGFDIVEFSNPAPSSWERDAFNLLKKEQWKVKSQKEVSDWKNAYYRFTIVKETYQSNQEARDRISRIREQPPGLSPEEDKEFPLRTGFNFDNVVYVVSCRVNLFHERLKGFSGELEKEVRKSRRLMFTRDDRFLLTSASTPP